MAKDPAFPFYASDFLTDTMRWTREMKSLHVDLLAESWLNGGLLNHGSTVVQPDGQPNVNLDYPDGLTEADQKIWQRIKSKWYLQDGMWFNEKLETVREKRKIFLKRQSDKGKASAEARKNKPVSKKEKSNRGSTGVEPIEKENEIEKEVSKYVEYSAEMREKFVRYWTEPDRKGKQKWMKQETWDTGRRLRTWYENDLERKQKTDTKKAIPPLKPVDQIQF